MINTKFYIWLHPKWEERGILIGRNPQEASKVLVMSYFMVWRMETWVQMLLFTELYIFVLYILYIFNIPWEKPTIGEDVGQ